MGDANQVVLVRGGETFRMSSSSTCGYGELVVTPDIEVLMGIVHAEGRHLFEHPLFRRRAALAGPAMQAARAWFYRWISTEAPRECLEAEEALPTLVRTALQSDVRRLKQPAAATAAIIRRAKEVLNERLTDSLRLADIAKEAGASFHLYVPPRAWLHAIRVSRPIAGNVTIGWRCATGRQIRVPP